MINTATFFSIHTSFAKVSSPDDATCHLFSATPSAVHAKTKAQMFQRVTVPIPLWL
jgi:hypothetical protein